MKISPSKKEKEEQKEVRAQMKRPIRNINDFSGKPSANQIACVLEQIDAMRAADGDQAAQGPTAEERPPLSQRQSEAEQ
jgi:hypothetical protein